MDLILCGALGLGLLTNSLSTNLIYPQWKIACWGDSLTDVYPPILKRIASREVFQNSNQGFTTSQIRTINTNASFDYVRDYSRVIWVGVNDFGGPAPSEADIDLALANVHTMVTNGDSRFLVLGTLNLTNWPYGTTNHWAVTNFNARLGLAYTNHYFDIRRYLIGLTNGSLADYMDHTNDVPLNSLRIDNIHPNALANGIIAFKVMERLMLIETNSLDFPVTRGELLQLLLNLPTVGPITHLKRETPAFIIVNTNGTVLFEMRVTGGDVNNAGSLFLGASAGKSNTTGTANFALGEGAMFSNKTGSQNTAIGRTALYQNIAGNNNTAIGTAALFANLADDNLAAGTEALYLNTTGFANTAIGVGSQRSNITGNRNTTFGKYSLRYNTEGDNNIAIGNDSLYGSLSDGNSAIGVAALGSQTTGRYNTALAYYSLLGNKTGNYNIGVGVETGYGDGSASVVSTNDDYTIFVGYRAGRDPSAAGTKLVNAIAIGKGAKVSASNQAVIGGTGEDAVDVVVGRTVSAAGFVQGGSNLVQMIIDLQARINALEQPQMIKAKPANPINRR